ncbi:Squamosa promoter-binding-like protein 7 [Citrus sinensis]|uniref:Squamosa promoter-binding-like protein 7 n=1 Tax=Citrus sinensis TaxID=2711 RepID=A0ACB8I865_CITSI|nr:Squamosa promoter-binding-like protein 7 [Citrus sinensis]
MERDGVERPRIPEMEVHPAMVTEADPSASALWDWSDLLDFTTDDHFNLPLDPAQLELNPLPELQPEPPVVNNLERVRKRDPRLTCSNFLAGRIPCACPELDEMLEEQEAGLPGKKRARTVRAGHGQGKARCQVPGCEADISELKGFHLLSDFDEGKRSCRRKLERHNNRRRRKSVDSKGAVDSEPPGASRCEDIICDDDSGKDSLCLSSQITDQEAFLESEDGLVSALNSAPNTQNVKSDSGISAVASGEIRTDRGKDDSKASLSPSNCDNKSSYSSLCPTGRISFKLYDWNPAEFPRRLRHQIFHWLASMPVELEGYIRPGCTILTVFIAMPKIMWAKLYEDPIRYVHNFVVEPGTASMLSGRGSMFVHLNNMIFHVKGGTSVVKVDVKVQAPKLHYVQPSCFEAGKPLEFVACGSNLIQPKLRFLISFAGKYLPHDYCIVSPLGGSEGESLALEHQFYKINVPHIEANLFGPAFIEVENESGLSNFIPVLIGDKGTCSEINIIQQRFEASFFSKRSQFMASGLLSDLCEVSALRQKALTELLVDIAWLLKAPASESFRQTISCSEVQRFNQLLSFLIYNESTTILEKMLQNMKILMNNIESNIAVNGISDSDMGLLLKYMDYARGILCQKVKKDKGPMQHSGNIVPKMISSSQSCLQANSLVPSTKQDLVVRSNDKIGAVMGSATVDRCEVVPLLNREVVMNVNLIKEWPRKSCSPIFSGRVLSSLPTVTVIAMAAVCFGLSEKKFACTSVSGSLVAFGLSNWLAASPVSTFWDTSKC